MQRTILTRFALTFATAAVLMSMLAGLAAAAAAPVAPFQHAPLNPAGEAYEVNLGANGSVWVSDDGAKEIWQVEANDAYTAYVVPEGLADARPGAAGEVWYAGVDNCTLNRLSPATPGVTSWSLVSGCLIQGIPQVVPQATAYDGTRVWAADFKSPQLFSFNGSSLCTYALSGTPGFLGTQGGLLWFGDRTNGRIARLNPASGALTTWQLATTAKPFDVVVAADGMVWWTDREAGMVSRFNPANNELKTYTLPAGSEPEKLATTPSATWYTDDRTHTLGQIDLATATGAVATLTATDGTLTPTCSAAPAPTTHTVTTRTGTMDWSAGLATTAAANGITTYQLSATALPWGIAFDGSSLVVADRAAAQVLDKISAAVIPEDLHHKVYLPILSR